MAKCDKCGEELVDFLFFAGHCPNGCDKMNTPLEASEDRRRKAEKKKMLKALANFNTVAWQLMGEVNPLKNKYKIVEYNGYKK